VGDSRVYKISTDTLTQLTQDHSYVNEMLKAGHITQKQARQHPKRNILTRVMGVDEFMEVDGYACVLDDACTVLLCSDGLYGMISDEEMTHLATAPTPAEHRARALVEAANAAGGTDNISVILINR
jgi:protein phosphatase